MTDSIVTTSAEIELELDREGLLELKFCDAQVSQWEESLDDLADYDDEQLVSTVATEIVECAQQLAESLVQDLRRRIAERAAQDALDIAQVTGAEQEDDR